MMPLLRVSGENGVFQVTIHQDAPVTETTVFLLCMSIPRATGWELLASSRTVFVGGTDVQFRDSALSWVNLLFEQYVNGKLKDKVLVDYFDGLRRWSENALLNTFGMKPGPLNPKQADRANATFQEAANLSFTELFPKKNGGSASELSSEKS